jgi:hypothetical protein
MTIELAADGTMTLDGQMVTLEQVQQQVREFAAVNPKHRVVAIKTDPQAKYDAYFQLQNALVAAYRPLKCAPRVSEVVEALVPDAERSAHRDASSAKKGGQK